MFWDIAPAISILAKQNMLCGVSQHSKVQVPCWMPFYHMLKNKRKNQKPTIYAAGDILQMYTEFIKNPAQTSNKKIHRNQKDEHSMQVRQW